MALKMGQYQQGIIVLDIFPHGHFGEPFSPFYRKKNRSVLVDNIHRAEGPAVYLQCFPVLLGGVTVPRIVSVCFEDSGPWESGIDQLLYPRPGDNVGAVLLSSVQLDPYLPRESSSNTVIDFPQTLSGQIPGKIDHRFRPRTLLIGDVGCAVFLCHFKNLLFYRLGSMVSSQAVISSFDVLPANRVPSLQFVVSEHSLYKLLALEPTPLLWEVQKGIIVFPEKS